MSGTGLGRVSVPQRGYGGPRPGAFKTRQRSVLTRFKAKDSKRYEQLIGRLGLRR